MMAKGSSRGPHAARPTPAQLQAGNALFASAGGASVLNEAHDASDVSTRRDRIPGVFYWGRIPVPFVAAWDSEEAISIRHDPMLNGAAAVFRSGSRGVGRPLFGLMDEARNRSVVIGRQCQICRRDIRRGGYAIEVPMGETRARRPILAEPLTCARCFRVSLELCPGIAKWLARPRLLIAQVQRYDVLLSTLKPSSDPSADPTLNAALGAWTGEPPIGYARLVLQEYSLIDRRDLLPAPAQQLDTGL